MNLDMTTHVGCGTIAALVGACMMVFFLATGAGSPEPSWHPGWMLRIMQTLPGHVFYLVLTFACLPAFLLASLAVGWGWALWVGATIVQMAIFFGGGLAAADLIHRLRS